MASYTEKNSSWSIEPAPNGAEVNLHSEDDSGRNRTGSMDEYDDEFVAVFSWDDVRREALPDEISDMLGNSSSLCLHNFVDRSNPFYSARTHINAIRRNQVGLATEIIESQGYNYDVKLEQSQFKFVPRPTVGEIIVKDKNAQS